MAHEVSRPRRVTVVRGAGQAAASRPSGTLPVRMMFDMYPFFEPEEAK
jgi:hypothetical protein